MINNVAILISTLIVLYVIVRATKLDRTLPWFTPAPPADPTAGKGRQGGAKPPALAARRKPASR